MRKAKWWLAWMVIGATAGTVGAIAYTLHQATRLPSWYAQSSVTSATPILPSTSVEAADVSEWALTGDMVERWVADAVANTPLPQPLERSVNQFNATVDSGELKAGTLVNLQNLPLDQLSNEERAWVERAIALVPPLSNREVFVGVELQPLVENGQVMLNDDATLQIGEVRMPLAVAARRLGVSVDEMERSLTQLLRNQGITPESIRIEGDRILINPL